MPSVLQGRAPLPPREAPAPAPMMPEQQEEEQQESPGQLVASIYEKPDGTYCTEDETGMRTEYGSLSDALDGVAEVGMGAMPGVEDEPEPPAMNSTDYN